MTWNNCIAGILSIWGSTFGVDYVQEAGSAYTITNISNCSNRLRVNVNEDELVAKDEFFKQYNTHVIVRKRIKLQDIVGLGVLQVRNH